MTVFCIARYFSRGGSDQDPGCLSVGACLSSEGSYVDRVAADSIHDCRQKCQLEYNRGCRYFTYFPKDTYVRKTFEHYEEFIV